MIELTEKEKNKLIERTAKHDANQAVYLWCKGGKKDFAPVYGDGAWYAKTKMEGHASWLKEQPYKYDYATSTFIPRPPGDAE